MTYRVRILKSCLKEVKKLPDNVQKKFRNLLLDLEETGPVQNSYQNYSKLGKETYHCHLSYHYVACWRNEKGSILVEVYYVGSRESAPYK